MRERMEVFLFLYHITAARRKDIDAGEGVNELCLPTPKNVYELSAWDRVTATSLPGFTERTVLSTAGSPGGSLPVLTFNPSTQTFSASDYFPNINVWEKVDSPMVLYKKIGPGKYNWYKKEE